MKKKYRREMDYVYAVINEMERKLERTIRDLDDVRLIMDTLKKIREQEVDMELKIDPVEVCDSYHQSSGKYNYCICGNNVAEKLGIYLFSGSIWCLEQIQRCC